MPTAKRTTKPFAIDYIPDVPDFLGNDTRITTVSDMIEQAQRQRLQYSQMMLVNNSSEDDEIPQQTIPGQDPPESVKYGERIAELDAGIRRLLADNEDIAKELADEAHARRKKAARARADADAA